MLRPSSGPHGLVLNCTEAPCRICRDQLPQPGLLSEQELSWLVAALYNVGVDLHSAGQFGAAVPPLLAAVSASMCCLMEVLLAGSDEQVGCY